MPNGSYSEKKQKNQIDKQTARTKNTNKQANKQKEKQKKRIKKHDSKNNNNSNKYTNLQTITSKLFSLAYFAQKILSDYRSDSIYKNGLHPLPPCYRN